MSAKNIVLMLICGVLFTACASNINILNAEAQSVRIVTNEPSSCEYMGEVYGYQSNLGGNLNGAQLDEGAINDAKNKAKKLGGNTIFLLNNQNKVIYSGNSGFIINERAQSLQEVNITALVYQCE